MRQIIATNQPDKNGCIRIEGKNYRYLYGVLRLKCGDVLDVRLQSGKLATMVIESVNEIAKTLLLAPASNTDSLLQSGSGERAAVVALFPETILLQWLPKLSKMDDIIRQATEIGVSTIIPVIGRFSPKEAQTAKNRLDRWNRIVTEARQQSGSPVATQVIEPQTMENALKIWDNLITGKTAASVFLSETPGGSSLHAVFEQHPEIAAVAVGCEGGYDLQERCLLEQAGFCSVHFITNVLRVETAAVYGLAAVQTIRTEWQTWKK